MDVGDSTVGTAGRGIRPKPATAAYLAEALARRARRPITPTDLGLGSPADTPAATGDLVGDLAHLGRMDVDRHGFLTAAFSLPAAMAVPGSAPLSERAESALRGGAVGNAEVDTVRDVVRADERLGGGVGRSAVVEYLSKA
ncbi:hypothetical protein HNR23_001064 [Nocardiopsis mwathae]|uniref:Uncharacterized protein n=1 Tax=Nocardiopsis mwathae TaxID=1472723 RepID=A0A7X0D5D1_9ACTN|nr:hypothetical protein [Nocardiopsis mwathae]MBB6171004.1 hypothetical protein [Nocardiopsis mwathae]